LVIYISRKAAERPEVRDFVEFYLKQGDKLVQEVKYLPLPDVAY
jgi:phosphate transport system substrate-binding protein